MESKGYVFSLVGDLANSSYYPTFSGLWGWINYQGVSSGYKNNPYTWESKINQKLSNAIEGHPDLFFCAAVWPGFDDSAVNGWGSGSRKLSRLGGDFYSQTWKAALESNAQCIMIMTFNDWNEGSNIEPSKEFGYLYSDLTTRFVDDYKGINLDSSKMEEITRIYMGSKK